MSRTKLSNPASWTPLLQLDGHGWIGIAGAELFIGDENGPKRLIDRDNPTGLLPCLERPYAVVLLELEKREAELSLAPGSLGEMVPLGRIPYAAVTSQIDYWVQLGLNWLEDMSPSDVDIDLVEALERESWPTQRARHRARGLRRRGLG